MDKLYVCCEGWTRKTLENEPLSPSSYILFVVKTHVTLTNHCATSTIDCSHDRAYASSVHVNLRLPSTLTPICQLGQSILWSISKLVQFPYNPDLSIVFASCWSRICWISIVSLSFLSHNVTRLCFQLTHVIHTAYSCLTHVYLVFTSCSTRSLPSFLSISLYKR